jgi:hypothetical protein
MSAVKRLVVMYVLARPPMAPVTVGAKNNATRDVLKRFLPQFHGIRIVASKNMLPDA